MVFLAAFVHIALAIVPALAVGVAPGQIKNLVTFGDSYSDSSIYPAADGGYAWPTWVVDYAHINLYGLARDGATCSNALTPRDFPPIEEWQLPHYYGSLANGTIPYLDPEETMYVVWIGTNDVGVGQLISGPPNPDVSLVQVRQCAVNVVKQLYNGGARNFIFNSMLTLDKTILYSNYSYPNVYWTEQRNTTEWNVFMKEIVMAGNMMTDYMLRETVTQMPGAHVASFDAQALFSDMYYNPQNYLNGTAPLNVTGCVHSCVYALNQSTTDTGDCTIATGSDADSFLWYDELHPSQQSDRNLAKEITAVIQGGQSQWATWLS